RPTGSCSPPRNGGCSPRAPGPAGAPPRMRGAASRRTPLAAGSPRPLPDAVEVELDDLARDVLRPVVARMLEDGGAREAEQVGGREVTRARAATQVVPRQDLLDGDQDEVAACPGAARPALLVALHQRQEVLPAPEEAQQRQEVRLEPLVERPSSRGQGLALGGQPLQAGL